MTISVDFLREDDELVMLLPVTTASGERLALERWGFEEVVAELDQLVEDAAAGNRPALRVYQRLVWALRKRKHDRQTSPPPPEPFGGSCRNDGVRCDREVCLGFDCPERREL